MRTDKYLFFVRLVKTRSLAHKLVEDRHFRIDGRVVERAHAEVKVGNVLTFPLRDRIRVIRVEAMPARRGPAPEAQACYTDLSPCPTEIPAE